MSLAAAAPMELLTITGICLSLYAGEALEAQGHWVQDRNHGLQFKALHLRVMAPTSLAGIEKYLSWPSDHIAAKTAICEFSPQKCPLGLLVLLLNLS